MLNLTNNCQIQRPIQTEMDWKQHENRKISVWFGFDEKSRSYDDLTSLVDVRWYFDRKGKFEANCKRIISLSN